MTPEEHYKAGERLAKAAETYSDAADALVLATLAQAHFIAADKAPVEEDLSAALIEAHKVAERIMFEDDEGAAAEERHCVDVWHGLSVKSGRGATPAEALGVAYAKLTAHLADAS